MVSNFAGPVHVYLESTGDRRNEGARDGDEGGDGDGVVPDCRSGV